jgi:hypothetical protein
MVSMSKSIMFMSLALAVVCVFLAGCTAKQPVVQQPTVVQNEIPANDGGISLAGEPTDQMIQFNSTAQFRDFLQQRMLASANP